MFTKLLEYNIFSGSKMEFMKYIDKFSKINIVSGNPEILYNGLHSDLLLKSFTDSNTVIIPDGVGTLLASKIVGMPVKEKIAGIEVMEDIIKKCTEEGKPIYLLGAKQDVLDMCKRNLKERYPLLKICGSHNGYFDLNNCDDVIYDIKFSSPYAIFVAMGAPKQDIFISQNMNKLPCSIFMGVGGSFDVFAGKVRRAPKWMIGLGLEWLYRVIAEPSRIKRLLSIPKFLLKVMTFNKI
ncbi:WecB/TagA/CpsF family glycosyltransferase [Clostridium sp. JNZ X4-2]